MKCPGSFLHLKNIFCDRRELIRLVANRAKGTSSPVIAGVLTGAAVAVAVMAGLSIAMAWMINRGWMPVDLLGYGSMGVIVLASASGATVTIKKVMRRSILMGGLTGATLILAVLAVNGLFFGGQYDGVFTTILMILVGCIVPGVIGSKKIGKGNVGRRKKRKLCRINNR